MIKIKMKRYALYQIHRLGSGYELGEAWFCCNESEKVFYLALERYPFYFYFLYYFYYFPHNMH